MHNTFYNKNIYQIYPLTFLDSNKDSIGDLQGIIQKLGYFKNLNIDFLLLSPVTKSPMKDNGYDVSNYYEINPLLGNEQDYLNLIKMACKKKIGIIFDLVLNHTSNQHAWFRKSIQRIKPFDEFYVWRDKPIPGFSSQFENSCWTYVPERKQYYLHQFSRFQPDLNWESPFVLKEFRKIINFWITKGVKGFRFDVVDMIGKQINKGIKINTPRTMNLLKKLGEGTFHSKEKNLLTIGECWSIGRQAANQYSKIQNPVLNTILNANYLFLNENESRWKQQKLNSIVFYKYKSWIAEQTKILEKALIPLFFENHDFARSISRIWEGAQKIEEKAKMLAVIHLLRKGISFIYQGQEMGLWNAKYKSKDTINDIETHKFIKNNQNLSQAQLLKSISFGTRDNPRKPLPWNKDVKNKYIPFYNYGKKYYPDNQKKRPNSVLLFYQFILNFKKQENNLFTSGKISTLYLEDDSLFGHQITYKTKTLLVLSNWIKRKTVDLKNYNIIFSQNYQNNNLEELGFVVAWETTSN